MHTIASDCEGLAVQTGDAAFASDRTLRIVCWSRAAEDLLGHKAEEVLGRSCSSVLRCSGDGAQPGCHGWFAAVLRGQQPAPVPPFDSVLRSREGAELPVRVSTALVSSPSDGPLLLHFLRDLSREREMERLLGLVAAGAARLCPEVEGSSPPDGAPSPVTLRERRVLALLTRGATTEGIAAELGISLHTARNHVQNILQKLGVHSRLEAVARARALGLA